MLLVDKRIGQVFPKRMDECDAAVVETALRAAQAQDADGKPESIQALTACSLRKGWSASFMRVVLPADVLSKIELDAPDGLSLNGPVFFAVLSDGKRSYFTGLRDGQPAAADVAQWLDSLRGDQRADFATADRAGRKPSPVLRFLE